MDLLFHGVVVSFNCQNNKTPQNWSPFSRWCYNCIWLSIGGSLVAKDYVLSAAHCVYDEDVSGLGVLIGAVCPYQSDNCDEPYQFMYVESVTLHPQYNNNTLSNDFALLKLASPANAEPVAM